MVVVTENPAVGATEVWEMYNTTSDAHPMHIHEVVFEVVNRQKIIVEHETRETARPNLFSMSTRLALRPRFTPTVGMVRALNKVNSGSTKNEGTQ